MSDPSSQPTQPLTDEELEAYAALVEVEIPGTWSRSERNALIAHYITAARRLLPEVSRLRAENTALAAKLDAIVAFVNEPTTPERAAGMATARRLVNDLMGIKSEPNQWEQMTNSALGLDQDGRGQDA